MGRSQYGQLSANSLDHDPITAAIPRQDDFILTCDHGRGTGAGWRNHGAKVAGAENIWLAVFGPDSSPMGERTNNAAIGQNQIAATLAALLGEDYHGAVPKSGSPIADLLPGKTVAR